MKISYDSLLALYLALKAAQRGDTKVVLSNKALQEWIGKKKLHTDRITELAKKIEPVFYKHLIRTDPNTNGHTLTLSLRKKEVMATKTKGIPIVLHLPSEDFICKALGLN